MSEQEYTPSAIEVRAAYCIYWGDSVSDGAAFDRWLAEHDRSVAAEALDAAAQDWLHGGWADTPRRSDRVADRMAASRFAAEWFKARASRIRAGVA